MQKEKHWDQYPWGTLNQLERLKFYWGRGVGWGLRRSLRYTWQKYNELEGQDKMATWHKRPGTQPYGQSSNLSVKMQGAHILNGMQRKPQQMLQRVQMTERFESDLTMTLKVANNVFPVLILCSSQCWSVCHPVCSLQTEQESLGISLSL